MIIEGQATEPDSDIRMCLFAGCRYMGKEQYISHDRLDVHGGTEQLIPGINFKLTCGALCKVPLNPDTQVKRLPQV